MTSEEISEVIRGRYLLLTSLALLVAVHLYLWIQRYLRLRCPPGPFPWPIVGNAAQLGCAPHLYFTHMAKKYGNVFQIKLGNRTVVVLNGDVIRTALIKKGAEFAGRPDFTSFRVVSNGKSMAFGNYSEQWKAHRKVAQSTVRAFSTINMKTKKTFESHVVSEVRELLYLLLEKSAEKKYFEPRSYLITSIANVMSAVCFGKRYSYTDSEFRAIVGRNDQFTKTVGAGSIVDVMPWLQYFPNPIKSIFINFKKLNTEFYDFIQNKVSEHRTTINSSIIRDMTDAFIFAMNRKLNGPLGVFLDKEHICPMINDIFGASQDTLSTALQWIILILVRFPDVQARLREEVDKVVERSRLPTIEDQPRLPYVMAFLHEAMRYTSFIPVTIPHATTNNTTIEGYHIPKGTVVFINQWSVNHDPGRWMNPEVFNPLRFLDAGGALDKDLSSNVLIFSMGKRRCIGEELSKMKLFLYTTLLTHQCLFSADPESPPKMDYEYGLSLKPKSYKITVAHRDTMDLLDSFVEKLLDGVKTEDRAG
ncbi:cytochrome P450 1B1 isoform X1 [Brienomyrus brachyistius]|uniref:cytochrome P450 1B1 isoform X1 n=1 Tax=Brienomyrus brachyistius TaxID=42636 RepID=UPI0020B3AD58|nr:cytochrome P450 1B1 isoform X1 [Brienomyrus brachyistius]